MGSQRLSNKNIPAGWWLSEHADEYDGSIVECYTNILGQQFFTKKDLTRYVKYAKKAEVSIYSPGFEEPICATSWTPLDMEGGKQRWRSLVDIYDQTVQVIDYNPGAASVPAELSNISPGNIISAASVAPGKPFTGTPKKLRIRKRKCKRASI